MSKFSDAAVTIKKAAVKYEQMVALAGMLEEIGSLEQIAVESKRDAEAARTEMLKAKDDAKKAKDKLESIETQAAEIVATAKEQAVTVSESIRREAEESAAVVVKTAQDQAAKLIADAAAQKASLSSEVAGLQRAVLDLKAELQGMTAKRTEAETQAELAEKKLADLKKKLQSFLA